MIFDFTTLRRYLLRRRSSDYSLKRWDYVVEGQMLSGSTEGYVVVSVVDLGVRI